MATVSKNLLSGSVNGKAILIAGTVSGSATQLHTAIAGTTSYDEVWLYAINNATSSLTCSILFGSTTEPNDVFRAVVNPNGGRTLLVDGSLANNGIVIYGYATVTNLLSIAGFCNRIT